MSITILRGAEGEAGKDRDVQGNGRPSPCRDIPIRETGIGHLEEDRGGQHEFAGLEGRPDRACNGMASQGVGNGHECNRSHPDRLAVRVNMAGRMHMQVEDVDVVVCLLRFPAIGAHLCASRRGAVHEGQLEDRRQGLQHRPVSSLHAPAFYGVLSCEGVQQGRC
jgi:hypothetical protein